MSEIDPISLKPAIEKYIPLGRSGLLPALHAAQKIYGWLSESVASEVAKNLNVPLADVHGVIEFYSLFYNKPVGKKIIRVCTDQACALKGGDGLLEHLCHHYDVKPRQTTEDLSLTIEPSPCLGLCELAPAVWTMDNERSTIGDGAQEEDRPSSSVYGPIRELTKNCGDGTTSLKKYGEYTALQKALRMKPEDVVAEIKASGLVGRGGAAFPTGIKWEGAAKAVADQKYIICNADESEPGTFKDRILLLDDPHSAIEGMCIAAYAIGANKGYIYIRGEYPYIVPVLETALNEARVAGYLGELFDIEIRVGAGAYICGEETALFESIEGKRGFPRVKPPFPTTNGLFDKPTVINNVETLCNVPLIISKGSLEYRKIGTEKSPGSKLFCVSGDVTQPGLYEAPFGVTLRELLDMAGGVSNFLRPERSRRTRLQSVLFGGAAGAFATPEHLDVKMTFEDLRAVGLPLGSGVVMVFDETRDMRDVLKRLGKFFAHESCGKCYPCQMGTQRQMEILNRVAKSETLPEDFIRLQDVGWTMTDASLCGLGQTAASAVLSAMKIWPELFMESNGLPLEKKDERGKKATGTKVKAKPKKTSKASRDAEAKPKPAVKNIAKNKTNARRK
ncbi:MAG: NAD(P)H-dependent oxidoreductase subunit E [Chloroflexi bacterium]|nr:NAD(P)H-dependent oxidoreductase subunit E [Chloroflexota bacterium]